MGNMSKLLNRPLKAFILYALLVLALSIPVYHYIVDDIWHKELDEHNEILKLKTEDGLNKLHLTEAELLSSIQLLNRLEPGINISPANSLQVKPDSLYTVTRENEYNKLKRIDRFRGLTTYIKVNGKPYLLTVETNVEEVDETLIAIAIITIFFFLILVGGFIFLNWKISKQIWKPFRSTLNRFKSFDLNSQSNIEFERSGIQEFEELNNTLKKLIEKNISVFKQQKEFSENASNELQTPLAVIKSWIDLLLQNNTLSKEQSEMIEALNIPLSRVSRIKKNLLLLSKIENQQFAAIEPVVVSEVVNDTL
ncbi:MAG: sensor histidine kinase, partial [Segetibacter sp.]|nr:sensor histidine kinase [Segetibacter sp.]